MKSPSSLIDSPGMRPGRDPAPEEGLLHRAARQQPGGCYACAEQCVLHRNQLKASGGKPGRAAPEPSASAGAIAVPVTTPITLARPFITADTRLADTLLQPAHGAYAILDLIESIVDVGGRERYPRAQI